MFQITFKDIQSCLGIVADMIFEFGGLTGWRWNVSILGSVDVSDGDSIASWLLDNHIVVLGLILLLKWVIVHKILLFKILLF